MATTTSSAPIHLAEAHRKLRSPLARLRGYIHSYVALEGAALVLLLLAAWFWIGLVLDWVPFALWRLDWLVVFPVAVRAGLLVVLAGLVGYLVFVRVRLNMSRFADPALALLLERKFPKLLGERLITAVELADPEKAAEYGYSVSMVQETIRQAAERIDQVPVREVFDWGRLYRRAILAFVATVGVYLVLALVVMTIHGLRQSSSALRGLHKLNDVVETYVERNFLLLYSRWPSNTALTVVSPADGYRMSVDGKLTVRVRAHRTMVADRSNPEGWRPAVWQDLKEHPEFAGGEEPKRDPPREWTNDGKVVLTVDEVDVRLNNLMVRAVTPAGGGPVAWQRNPKGRDLFGKIDEKDWRPLLWHELRGQTAMALPKISPEIMPPYAPAALVGSMMLATAPFERSAILASTPGENQLTFDEVLRQLPAATEKYQATFEPIARDIRAQEAFLEQLDELNKVLERVSQAATEMRHSRTFRQLEVPETVELEYWGNDQRTTMTLTKDDRDRFQYVGVVEKLKEGDADEGKGYKYRASTNDFTTPTRGFSVVAAPTLVRLFGQEDQPAYLFHRSSGLSLWPGASFWNAKELRGQRQKLPPVDLTNYPGAVLAFNVPTGSDVRLTGNANRPLGNVKLVPAEAGKVELDGDDGFAVTIVDARDTLGANFTVEFYDRNGIKGERKVRVKASKDEAPKLPDLLPETVRQTKEGYKVTVGSRIPFRGRAEDDKGLQRIQYRYKIFKKDVMPPATPKAKLSVATAFGLACAPTGTGLFAMAALIPTGNELLRAIAPDVLIRTGTAELPGFNARMAQSTARRLLPSELARQLADAKTGVRTPDSFVQRYDLKPDAWDENAKAYVTRNDFLIKELGLKAAPGGVQERYGVVVVVEALDNDVEGEIDSDGRVMPHVTATETFSFLVVGQDELESEIDKEQAELFVKIAAVNSQLKGHLGQVMNEQNTLASSKLPELRKEDFADYEKRFFGVRDRLDRLRSQLEDYHSTVHAVRLAYDRIGEEERLNDFTGDRLLPLQQRVVLPLHRLDDNVKDKEYRDEQGRPDGNDFDLTVQSLQRYYVELGKLQQATATDKFAEVMGSCNTLAEKAELNLIKLQNAMNSLAEYLKEQDGPNALKKRLAEIRRAEAEAAEKLRKRYLDFVDKLLGGGDDGGK